MSTTKRISMLIAGLGINADASKFPIHKVEEVLAIEMKNLSDAGIYSKHITLNPNSIEDSMQELKKMIASREWDVFQIGFAVRGTVESSEVFEQAVNTWVESMPGKKLIFPKGPFDIASAAIRVYGTGE